MSDLLYPPNTEEDLTSHDCIPPDDFTLICNLDLTPHMQPPPHLHTRSGYRYTNDLLQLEVHSDALVPPSPWLSSALSIATPLIWWEWESALARHPDQTFCQYLISGIKHGFRG